MNNDKYKKLCSILKTLTDMYPDWRFGQLVINVAQWARGPVNAAAWDVTDEEWISAADDHISKKNR